MIRAKNLNNLSSTARSFFIGGTRSNAVEESSSCSCTDDDTCVSRRQQIRNDVTKRETKPATFPQRPSVSVVDRVLPTHVAAKSGAPKKVDHLVHPSLVPRLVSAPSSLGRVDSVNYARSAEEDLQDSAQIGDQIFRAGIAAVNLLSDLVNGKIPFSDGSQLPSLPVNCMIDPARTVSVKPSNVKTIRREHFVKAQEPLGKTHSSNRLYNKDAQGEKSSSVKGSKQAPNVTSGNSFETKGTWNGKTSVKKKTVPQRSKGYSNGFVPGCNSNVRNSDVQFKDSVTRGLSRPSTEMTKGPPGVGQMSRQFSNKGYVVENVSDVLRRFGWGVAAEEALQNLRMQIDPFQANQILKNLDDHSAALSFFNWLKRQPGFKHDGHTYTTMVGILGRAKQFGMTNKLLDQMVGEGCKPNTVTFNRLIHSYGRANYLKDAMNVFHQMQEAGCQPDRVTYCTLIDIHAKSGYLDIAMDLYQRMQAAGLSPDTFTYSVIINCLGKGGHLDAAHRLFCEMVGQGCVPNLVTFNIMIALHAKARNYPTALKLYRDMQNAGFQPDKVTYSIVMEVLGHCGYIEEAEAVFTEMQRKHWVPDEPVYGLLVDLWGKAGNVEKAWEWYQAMLHAGLRPNVPTCNSLLSTFLRVHMLPEAYNLLQNMLAFGLQPSLQTYTLLLSSCTESQSNIDMCFCCQLMGVTGHPAHMFLVKMPSAGPDGQNVRDHASKFLDFMHSEDRESKRGLVDAVVDFLHKTGLKEEASSVWEVAAMKNVYPDALKEKSSSYWLINLHVMSEGTAVTALSRTLAWFRREMLVSGVGPSRIDIVTGWGRRSRVTGSSLVRQAVQELLNVFSSPFSMENGNSGCFVGCGEPLNRWLMQSYVERMHLL